MSLMSQHPPDIRHVVVHAARAEARADGSYVVEAEHVLLALADQEGTTAQRLLISAGLGRHSLRTALDREREASLRAGGVSAGTRGLPMSSAGPHRSPPLGASVKRLLLRGHSAAKAHGGGRISSTHLLLGILGAHVGTVPRALALAGVDQAGLAKGPTGRSPLATEPDRSPPCAVCSNVRSIRCLGWVWPRRSPRADRVFAGILRGSPSPPAKSLPRLHAVDQHRR